jgi:periplasmic divalent cation tolerance protein
MIKAYSVYITASSVEEARRIGGALVEERLAACVNIVSGMESLYWWEGAMQQSQETILLAKTNETRLAALIDRASELHSYDCPCILAFPLEKGYEPYLVWLHNSVR